MSRTYKICSTILIMMILAVLIVVLVNFLKKKPKETYEGVLVQQIQIEEETQYQVGLVMSQNLMERKL